MNLNKIKEELLNLGNKINLQVEEETKDSLTVHTELVAKDYFPNPVYFRLVVYAEGTFHMFLTFDEIEKTYDNLFLVNNFNVEHPWFKAYIINLNGKTYLELKYVAIALEKENEVTDTVGYLLNEVLKEVTTKILNPILKSNK